MNRKAERIVDRIKLKLTVHRTSVLQPHTTSIVLYTGAGNHNSAAAAAPRPRKYFRDFLTAALSLECHDAEAHERASYRADELRTEITDDIAGVVHILLSDGQSVDADASMLAKHSPMFAALLRSPMSWREGSQTRNEWEVSLVHQGAQAVRLALDWMESAYGAPKREAAKRLMSPDVFVSCARLAHYLELAPLLDAAVQAIDSALDTANAPSILLLARELHLACLEERASRFIISQLDAVSVDAEEYWKDLPKLTKDTLAMLREATLRNPLLSAHGSTSALSQLMDCTSSDLRELLAMVRESLAEMRDRFEQARGREAEELVSRGLSLEWVLSSLRLEMYAPALESLGYDVESLCTLSPDSLHSAAERCGMAKRQCERFASSFRARLLDAGASREDSLHTLDRQAARSCSSSNTWRARRRISQTCSPGVTASEASGSAVGDRGLTALADRAPFAASANSRRATSGRSSRTRLWCPQASRLISRLTAPTNAGVSPRLGRFASGSTTSSASGEPTFSAIRPSASSGRQ